MQFTPKKSIIGYYPLVLFYFIMIVSVPNKAKDSYIKLCHDAYNAESENDYYHIVSKAEIYSTAIKDICGLTIWAEIVREADMSFPEEIGTCCGVPFTFKNKQP